MLHHMYEVDALILTRDKTISTNRGSITASTAALLEASNYSITLPVSLSSHAAIDIVMNSSPTSLWDYTSQSVHIRSNRLATGIPIANPNFENNWVIIGAISPDALSAVVSN